MSTSPEEVKKRAKQLIGAMMKIREETLQIPILRKRLLGFTSQIRGQRVITVPQEVVQPIQSEEEGSQTQPQIALPFQRPRLLQQMPIRGAVANLINALTVKSTGVTQSQHEDEQAYEEREKDLEASQMARDRLRRHGVYKGHSIEM